MESDQGLHPRLRGVPQLLCRGDGRALIAAEETVGNADWVAARIREFDGNHDKGAGAVGEYIAAAFRAGRIEWRLQMRSDQRRPFDHLAGVSDTAHSRSQDVLIRYCQARLRV